MHSLSLLNENLLNGGFCSIVLVEIKHPNSNPFLLDFNGIFRVEKNEQSSIMCAFFKLLPSLQLFGLKMSLEQKLSKSLNCAELIKTEATLPLNQGLRKIASRTKKFAPYLLHLQMGLICTYNSKKIFVYSCNV